MKAHEQAELELARDNFLKIVPALLGMYGPVAKLSKAYFDELVQAGFTEGQAMYVVAMQGVTARMGGENTQ